LPLVLRCGYYDPYIGFPLEEPVYVSLSEGEYYEVELTYRSDAGGVCQVFYDFRGFNEEDSARRDMYAAEDLSVAIFSIPASAGGGMLRAVRVDPPDGALFEIESLQVIRISMENGSYAARPIDYDYLGSFHLTELGQIPYIWGQYDNKKSWDNEAICEYGTGGAMSLDVQRLAKYAMLTVDSPEDGYASLTFQNEYGETVSAFEFALLEGRHRYIVRVSTDWWWNNGVIAAFEVDADYGAEVVGVSFLKGD